MWLLIITSALGFGIGGLFPKNTRVLFKTLLSPALGLFVFTQLALFFSLLLGVGSPSILLSLVTMAVLSCFCFLKFKQETRFENLPVTFILVFLIITSFLTYVWLTQALSISNEGFKTGGGGMYGDTALHSAYTSRLEGGEFPIQNPLFAGKTLVYPLANDLLSAALRIAGLNFNLAFALPQILFLIGFLALFYQIVRKFTRDIGFIISITLLFLGWGIGALFFLNEWAGTGDNFWQFLTRDYTNNAGYNLYFHNILSGLILPERSFLPGLFLGLLIFLNFFEYFQSRNLRFLFINGIILGSLPFWHTHTFIFFSIASLIFAIWSVLKIDIKKSFRDFGLMFVVSLIMAIPFLILFFTNKSIGDFVRATFGWQNGDENIILFWFKNSLFIIPLAVGGFWLLKKEERIFLVPAFVVFVISNMVIFQPWEWDNIKLLSWSFLFFAILAGVFLARLISKGSIARTLLVAIVLASISGGILSLALQLKNKYVIYDRADIDLANWAKKNTNINDVFVIEPFPNHPIPGLAGRLVYLGYPGHLWVHGIDYGKREQENNQVLAGDFSQVRSLEVPISYIVTTKNNFNFPPNILEVYQNQKYRVLKIVN